MLTQGGNVLSFQKGHLAYSNAKLLTEMHMELSGIRKGTIVGFGLQCKVVLRQWHSILYNCQTGKAQEGPHGRAVESNWNMDPSTNQNDLVPDADTF